MGGNLKWLFIAGAVTTIVLAYKLNKASNKVSAAEKKVTDTIHKIEDNPQVKRIEKTVGDWLRKAGIA